MTKLAIDLWSDIACPWCFIGKRRFEKALSRFPQRDSVVVRWRSFQLDPGAPRDYQGTVAEMLAEKYGVSLEQAERMNARVSAEAAREGLAFRLEKVRHGNTLDAHRLTHFAEQQGLRERLTERLFQAYFGEGADLNDAETLTALARETGLDPDAVRAVLSSDAYADAVRADLAQARALGVTGVPFFVLGGRYGVSGAQPSEVFLSALERAWRDLEPLTLVGGRGAGSCDDGSCAV